MDYATILGVIILATGVLLIIFNNGEGDMICAKCKMKNTAERIMTLNNDQILGLKENELMIKYKCQNCGNEWDLITSNSD